MPKKADLLAAAAGLIRRKGFLTVTHDELAAAAGVTPAALAKHFPEKDAVLAALYAAFHAAAFAPPADPVLLPDRFRKAAKKHAAAFAAVVEVLATGADVPAVTNGLGESTAAVAESIRAAQAAGRARRGLDAEAAARDWLRYLFGAELLKDADPPAADLLLRGLLKTDI